MHSRTSLIDDLNRSGLHPADTVLIHSSMKSIGQTEGGADTVLDALSEYFQPDGLLVFPTLTYGLNEENPVFDIRRSPSQVGLLTELFRKRPGVIRSLHPTHSVAALGRDAQAFTEGHEQFDTPCARTSPWGRLADRKAKILFIGTVTMHCNTFLHGVEEWSGVPGMLTDRPQHLTAVDYRGIAHSVPSRRHLGSHSQYYDKMRPLFAAAGLLQQFRFGDADCYLLDARGAMHLVMDLLKKEPLLFTHA